MRIAATAAGTTIDSVFAPKFARCRYFLLIDTGDAGADRVECVENPHRTTSGGAGTRAAQLLVDQQITMLLTGEAGPNARRAMQAAGIKVVTGCSGRIADAVAGLGGGSIADPAAGLGDTSLGDPR